MLKYEPLTISWPQGGSSHKEAKASLATSKPRSSQQHRPDLSNNLNWCILKIYKESFISFTLFLTKHGNSIKPSQLRLLVHTAK